MATQKFTSFYFFKMYTDMTAITLYSNKIVLNTTRAILQKKNQTNLLANPIYEKPDFNLPVFFRNLKNSF